MIRVFLGITLLAAPSLADVVVPTKTIRSGTIISAQDVMILDQDVQGAFQATEHVIGSETTRTLYAKRPIFASDITHPALVERNQTVMLLFETPTISIITEGRSLGRGGVGKLVKAMNLSSKTVVYGHVQGDGTIKVKQ